MSGFDGMGWGMGAFGGIGMLLALVVVVGIVAMAFRRRN